MNQAINPKKLAVALKETTLFGSSSKKLDVSKVKLHENFRTEENQGSNVKFDYNVGLLMTELPIQYSLHASPVCLPESIKFDFKDKKGVVVGWGLDKNHQLSRTLQQLEVPTFPFLDCFYRNRDFFGGYASKRNFCAGFRKDKGICSGDAGGGLFIKNGNRWVVYGLSSFSNCKCVKETQTCQIFDEGIFVNMPAYVQWIHNNKF